MKEGLLKEISAHGDRGAIVSVSYFDELKRELEALRTDNYFRFSDWASSMIIPDELGFQPRSLISVITPSQKLLLDLLIMGKRFIV